MNYEYNISMIWHNEEEKSNNKESTINITPEMINAFAIFNDYAKAYMPVAYATLTLNKATMDKIIKNVKTAYFNVSVQKMEPTIDGGATVKVTTPYTGKCVYFIDQDINYNKELDYINEENEDKPASSITQTISIGLMWSNCIEYNKQTNNTTIVNTDMFNTVYQFLQGVPLLIEPFEYNENIEQLIITPKESLVKTINFLNDIKVFYSTKFRIYFDPDCVYLLSSSGNGVKRRGEKYNDCLFNVRSITDPAAYKSGMEESKENNCYYMDIHVKDSYYTIDSDTNKVFNEIESIIDPGVNNTPPFLSAVNQAIGNVNKLVDGFNSAIKGAANDLASIPRTLGTYRCEVNFDALELATILIGNEQESISDIFVNHYPSTYSIQQIRNELEKLHGKHKMVYKEPSPGPTSTSIQASLISSEITKMGASNTLSLGASENASSGSWVDSDELIIEEEDYQQYMRDLENYKNAVINGEKDLSKSGNEFSEISGGLTGILAGTTNLPGCLNCVDATNMGGNSDRLSSEQSKLKSQAAAQQVKANEIMALKESQCNSIINTLSSSHSLGEIIYDLYEAANLHTLNPSTGEWDKNPNPFEIHLTRLSNDIKTVPAYINDPTAEIIKNYGYTTGDDGSIGYRDISSRPVPMLEMFTKYKSWCDVSKDIVSKVEPQIKGIQEKANNIKSLYTNTLTSIQNIGKTAKQSLDNIIGAAKDIENKVKSLNFDIKSLPDIQKDINAVKDIANIGMLGISSLGINLKLGGNTATGKKIVRISNDNANKLKNIKNEIEMFGNKISISKTDIDTTVFTLNKRYIIKNYDAHANKNGIFNLIKKSDFFTRAGNTFKISTQLEFVKVKDGDGKDNSNNKSTVMSKLDRQREVQSLLTNANSILQISKQGVKLSDIGSILNHAIAIQESYNKMTNSRVDVTDLRTGGIFGNDNNR